MQWSPIQEQALAKVSAWLKTDEQVFILDGYAGTGKTTLARHLAQSAGRVAFAAFTGKAASVLRSKGCDNATTIHKLIYSVSEKPEHNLNRLRRELRETPEDQPGIRAELERYIAAEEKRLDEPDFNLNDASEARHCDLVIVDERSMINQQIGEDLLAFGTKLLLLGDPAQLPPVKGHAFMHKRQPDVLLTEIHRQARDNPIIQLATKVRNGERLKPGNYGSSTVLAADYQMNPEQALGCDQIIVGKNTTRRAIIDRMRSLQGYSGYEPQAGEKLICLRNNDEYGILNGQMWKSLKDANVVDDDSCILRVTNGEDILDLEAHRCDFRGVTYRDWCKVEDRDYDKSIEWGLQRFDYGYAITCHKSQGSQWDKVCIFNQSSSFGEPRKWLYTAITRAAESVLIKEM